MEIGNIFLKIIKCKYSGPIFTCERDKGSAKQEAYLDRCPSWVLGLSF